MQLCSVYHFDVQESWAMIFVGRERHSIAIVFQEVDEEVK